MNTIDKIDAFEAYSALISTNKMAAGVNASLVGGVWIATSAIFMMSLKNFSRLIKVEEKENENE